MACKQYTEDDKSLGRLLANDPEGNTVTAQLVFCHLIISNGHYEIELGEHCTLSNHLNLKENEQKRSSRNGIKP